MRSSKVRTPRPYVGEGRRERKRTRGEGGGGFTLIEVIVALAICSCALVMLASVGNESLRRSLRARNSAMLDQSCQNKLAEYACGAEVGRQGNFAKPSGWRWKVEVEPLSLEELTGIERVTLHASSSEGQGKERVLSMLRYRPRMQP
jgi:prepilin-type N-terminal cleavage/methylation domain-containing protein